MTIPISDISSKVKTIIVLHIENLSSAMDGRWGYGGYWFY